MNQPLKYLHMSDGEWNTYVHAGKQLKKQAAQWGTTTVSLVILIVTVVLKTIESYWR